ncbi:MAG: RNA polymerase sigma factor [Acidobacteria bacterium]|nr:RNA polymerase sigma factor [Acidobacteriota bacterium]
MGERRLYTRETKLDVPGVTWTRAEITRRCSASIDLRDGQRRRLDRPSAIADLTWRKSSSAPITLGRNWYRFPLLVARRISTCGPCSCTIGSVTASHADEVRALVERIYRDDSRRIFATLIRLVGDFDLAEEALHEAFATAIERWPVDGIPEKPVPWLVSTGRFKAIDTIRRMSRFESDPARLELATTPARDDEAIDEEQFRDDQLRLVFTCCHPALPPATRVAMTLREMCGLTTEEVARAFLTSPSTIAQRIVRGKSKLRDEKIAYQVPALSELPDRLESVLSVIYLVFNEGYSASSGDSAIRQDLATEAIRLGRVLVELLPDPEAIGLLALMLLHDSRRAARIDGAGELTLLEDQDRSLWDREAIAEGLKLVDRAIASREIGAYTIQAAISAVHAGARDVRDTDWARIVALYDLLLRIEASPIAELNRAVAVAMRDGPEAGIVAIDRILERGELTGYHLAHAARADLYRRLGRNAEAREAYELALAASTQTPERRFLERRLRELL